MAMELTDGERSCWRSAHRRARLLTVIGLSLAPAWVAGQALQGTDDGGGVYAYTGRVPPPMTAPRLPDLGSDSTKPAADAAPRQWDRALPFLAQRVIDRGIDLPNPYDVGVSLYVGREARILSSLQVGFNGGAPLDASFVQFPSTHVETKSLQLQAGAWLFPFMNVYAIVGSLKGGGDIDIAIPGRELMAFLGVPGCNLAPALQPTLCTQTLRGTAHADYDGSSYGAGVTLAGMVRDVFFALPVTYVVSDLSQSTTKSKTWNLAPRLGLNQHLSDGGMLTWYAGGTYMKSDIQITGSFTFDTSATPIGAPTTLSYSIHVEPSHRWNYLAGVSWTINRSWGAIAEVGFGNQRNDLLLTAFFRF